MKANTYLIVNRYQKSRTSDRRPYITLACEYGGAVRKKTKPIVDDEEEKVSIKRQGPYGAKKCGCPFKLKGEQMATIHKKYTMLLRRLRRTGTKHIRGSSLLKCIMGYNMPLLEAVGMTPTGKNFKVATAFMCNEQLLHTDGVWTSEVLHFGVETTNYAKNEHSVLKLWLSTCHGDLDTVFLNIISLIEGQIAEIKTSFEISKLKRKIWLEIKRAGEISDDPQSMCGHYLRKSHGLPCTCELVGQCVVSSKGYKSGIARRSLCSINNRPRNCSHEGTTEDESTKRDKSYWEYVSIAHRKIGKSSSSESGSRSGSGSGSDPSPRGRGRPPRSGRGRGRGRNSGRSNLSSVVNPDVHSTLF
ncbi:hypothetical protein M9H77_27279 [Catharanthus roseus]|uniref:Uncharacterized protein n=1 Tax=Catharanthus roseus TaxID=4058 RepID=A0ACC0AG59_CATRO|nr:hypothetical protein M9H77_27279 [Catharanthus roseus]